MVPVQLLILRDVGLDARFSLGNLGCDKREVGFHRADDSCRMCAGTTAIRLGLALLMQGLQMAHEGAEFADFASRGRPGRRLFLLTKAGNQGRVNAVRLVAAKLTAGRGDEPRRINDADHVTSIRERQRNRISIRPRCF